MIINNIEVKQEKKQIKIQMDNRIPSQEIPNSNEFKSSININKIIEITELGKSYADIALGQCAILVLGSTGCGKSTYANFLNGRELKLISEEVLQLRPGATKPRIGIIEKVILVNKKEEDFEIGHDKQSHTIQIKAISLTTGDFIICDFPGFFDNRSLEHEIANQINLTQFLSNCKSVVPVILINYQDFKSVRGESFTKFLDLILNLLKNPAQEEFNKCLFLYTHARTETPGLINGNLIKEQDGLNLENKGDKIKYELLDNLMDQIQEYGDLIILNPTKQLYNDHLELIKKKVPFQQPTSEFNFSLSNEAKLSITNYTKDVCQQITNWLMQQEYQCIFNLLKSFKKFKDLLDYNFLTDNYDSIIHSIKDFTQQKYNKVINDFSESAQVENFLSKKTILDILDIKDQLALIDRYKDEYLNDFEITSSKFIQQIQQICQQISIICIQNFTENIQLTKDNLQKLLQIQQDFLEVKQIFNNCKEELRSSCLQKQQQYKGNIDQFFLDNQLVNEQQKFISQIEQIGISLQELLHIENFLKPYYQSDDCVKMDFYGSLLNYLEIKCKQQLEIIEQTIKSYKKKIKQNKIEVINEQLQDKLRQPNFEICLLKYLSKCNSINQHVKINTIYEEAIERIEKFILWLLKQVQDILDANQYQQHFLIQQLLIQIDQIRNLDDSIRSSTFNQYQKLQDQLNQLIISNRETVELILDKYINQGEGEDEELLGQEVKLPNLKDIKQDFKKLKQIFQFLMSMSWTDIYFKKTVVSTTVTKIKEIISQYMDEIYSMCKQFVDKNKFKNTSLYLLRLEALKEISEAIEEFDQKKQDFLQKISDIIMDKLKTMEQKFNDQKENLNYIKQQEWKSLNDLLNQLLQIHDLNQFPLIKDFSGNLIENINNQLQKYYSKQLLFIKNNNTIELVSAILKKNEVKQQAQFVENMQFIIQECQYLYNAIGKNNTLDRIRDSFIEVYSGMYEEYADNVLRKVEPQQSIDQYNTIKQYINELKFINILQSRFESFKQIINPQKIIQDKFAALIQQIRNDEVKYIKELITPLLSLKSKEDKLSLSYVFLEICNKINLFAGNINYELSNHLKMIDGEFVAIIKLNYSKLTGFKSLFLDSYNQNESDYPLIIDPLFKNLQQQIDEFISTQISIIKLNTKKFQFQQMEDGFIYLNQFISIVNDQKLNDCQQQIKQLKKEIIIIIEQLLYEEKNISQPESLQNFNNSLKNFTVKSNHFENVLARIQGEIKGQINLYVKSQIDSIINLIYKEEFYKSKEQFGRLKVYVEAIKQINININQELELYSKFLEIEDKIQEMNDNKIKRIDALIENGYNDDVIQEIINHKKCDKELYFQSTINIKNTIQHLLQLTLNQYPNLEETEFTKRIQKINNVYYISNIDNKLGQLQNEITQLIQSLISISQSYIVKVNAVLEFQQPANDINISDLFKHKILLNILLSFYKGNDQLNETIKEVNLIEQKLIQALKNLKEDQEQFLNSGGINPSHKDLKAKCAIFESFIQLLNYDKQKNQIINTEIADLGKQLLPFENLLNKIQQQVQKIEQQMYLDWQQEDFKTLQQKIEQLNKKRKINQSIYSEMIDLNGVIQKFEDKIDKMTKEALSIIQYTRKYDSKFNSLINRIYKAEKYLQNQNGLQYKSQSQIQLVENQIIKKIEEIKQQQKLKSQQNKEIQIQSVSKTLIKIEKIAQNVQQFNQIVNKHNTQILLSFFECFGKSEIYNLAQKLNETSTGMQIVENYPIFKLQKIQSFYERQLQYGEQYIFDQLKYCKIGHQPLSLEQRKLEALQRYLSIFNQVYDNSMEEYIQKPEKSWDDQVSISIETIQKYQGSFTDWNDQAKKVSASTLGHICVYWTLSQGELRLPTKNNQQGQQVFQKLTVSQLISIMMLLGFDQKERTIQNLKPRKSPFKNKLIEILSGEGKSLVLGICSIFLALIGYDVDILCYSTYLQKRDQKAFSLLFIKFGVESKIKYSTFREQSEKFISQFEEVNKQTLYQIQNINYEKKAIQNKYAQKVLLIDEVDVFFGDLYGQTFNPKALFQSPEIEEIIKYIWQLKSKGYQEIFEEVILCLPYKKLLYKYPNMQDYFRRQIEELSNCVKQIDQHKNNNQYIVANDKISYKYEDPFSTYHFYHTLFAYYRENQSQKELITNQSLNSQIGFQLSCGQLSYALLPNQYLNILGVTSTLKSLHPVIKQSLKRYKITREIYIPSIFGQSKRNLIPENIVPFFELDQAYSKINSIAQQAYFDKQPIIIFFKSKQEITNYMNNNEFLKSIDSEIIILTEGLDCTDIDYKVKKSAKSKNITLCVREYGRGTDFLCYDPQVETKEGLVIIQSFLSNDLLEQIQIQGRAARQGNKSDYHLILNEKDLVDEFKITKEQFKNWKNLNNKELFELLEIVRDKAYQKQYEQLNQKIDEAETNHAKTLVFYENLQKQENVRNKIIEYINQFG